MPMHSRQVLPATIRPVVVRLYVSEQLRVQEHGDLDAKRPAPFGTAAW